MKSTGTSGDLFLHYAMICQGGEPTFDCRSAPRSEHRQGYAARDDTPTVGRPSHGDAFPQSPPPAGLRGEGGAVTTHGAGGDGTPEERDGIASRSEEIWLKFLTDNERAIRASAPREPSARERGQGRHPRPLSPDGTRERKQSRHDEPTSPEADAVGELWQPVDLWAGPAWRDLDSRARVRRVGRAVATAAAIALALAAWSWVSTTAGTPSDTLDDITVQQSEQAPQE